MDLKFMQDLHNKEFAMKDRYAQRTSNINAGLTTLGGFIAFVVVNFKSVGSSIDIVFWLLIVASCIALSTAAYYLFWSSFVPTLEEIASPKEWLSYWNELKEQVKTGEVTSAETEFTDYLLGQYAEIADRNIDANFNRGTRLVKSNRFLQASFVFIVVTTITFYYNNYILGEGTRRKGDVEMYTGKEALICIPATKVFDAIGKEKPGPRQVPDPKPPPPGR